MNLTEYASFGAKKAVELLSIDSPTGYTAKAAEWVQKEFSDQYIQTDISAVSSLLILLSS